jgi:hypothetical protein
MGLLAQLQQLELGRLRYLAPLRRSDDSGQPRCFLGQQLFYHLPLGLVGLGFEQALVVLDIESAYGPLHDAALLSSVILLLSHNGFVNSPAITF